MNKIHRQFGNIDIYLFDQLLKGRFLTCKNILDLGCGKGRNLVYFLREGYNVYGIDKDPDAISELQLLRAQAAPLLTASNFKVAEINPEIPFPKGHFDLIICNAVLHFANDKAHFETMLYSAWDLLAPEGYFFARLASSIGIEEKVIPMDNGRYQLPDGSSRFLVNAAMIAHYNQLLEATPYEELKTTVVEGKRAMTTWCIQKKA